MLGNEPASNSCVPNKSRWVRQSISIRGGGLDYCAPFASTRSDSIRALVGHNVNAKERYRWWYSVN